MHLDVVTPRGRLLSEEVEELTAPGVLGEFGVLPGHIPFLTGLKPGLLTYRGARGTGRLVVGPGYVEVAPGDRIVVLAERGLDPANVDAVAARKERDEAQLALDHFDGEDMGRRAELESRRDWAQAQLEAAGGAAH